MKLVEGAVAKPYSGLMVASLTTLRHFSSSASKNLVNSTGFIRTITAPSASNCFFTSGESSTALISVFSLATIAGGVPAGAPMPHQFAA